MKHLTLEDIKIPKPDFTSSKMTKGEIITKWLVDWVKYSLEYGIADFGDLIPSKHDLASFLGVSSATMQNSIREVKNLGYFNSKQSIGTCIADFYSKEINDDGLYHGSITECKIKKIILEKGIKINSPILSIQELSSLTHISQNTIRFSLANLARQGYLEKKVKKGNKCFWIYKKQFELTKDELFNGIDNEDYTLVNQLVFKIQKYIEKTYKKGERIIPNRAISAMFNVSIKTVNDAMKILNSKKIILSRRGKYGTIYIGDNQSKKMEFLSSERKKPDFSKDYNYSWEKALVHLKKYILENYEAGDKIAPIRELALILNVSPNTIRRALTNLVQNGNLITKRGKLGGIFITDMPEPEQDNYRWLALNPDVIFDN